LRDLLKVAAWERESFGIPQGEDLWETNHHLEKFVSGGRLSAEENGAGPKFAIYLEREGQYAKIRSGGGQEIGQTQLTPSRPKRILFVGDFSS